MNNPISSYRLQFNKSFTLDEFEKIIPYLQELGVSTVYASPIFDAVPGSTHGYDVFDHNLVNPEIGSEGKLSNIAQKIRTYGMHWLQDIVPNHMAFDPRNPWLWDVLEEGRESEFAAYFDIDWDNEERLMVPFLGAPLQEAIKKGELKLAQVGDKLVLKYFDATYPISFKSFQRLTGDAKKERKNLVNEINSDPTQLHKLADEQYYRLCHWQEADKKINYRRFFTVNGLICLNIQDKKVMEEHHAFIRNMIDEGVFHGLRIDHIDGLYNPTAYLQQLKEICGPEVYIIVEKILGADETMPSSWPVQGSTGYDFLAIANNLFTKKSSEDEFTNFYSELIGDNTTVDQSQSEKKAHILSVHMGGELENLFQLYKQSNPAVANTSVTDEDIKSAIAGFLVACPVYRFYGNVLPLDETEASAVTEIFARVKKDKPYLEGALKLLSDFILNIPADANEAHIQVALHFYMRCMQFTGPLMAKGVEDTLMYTYNRFIAHNEVGDSPSAFGITVDEFHHRMMERQKYFSLTLNATSTHDTKRGEDVRARLSVLSEIPGEWFSAVKEWEKMNRDLKTAGAPDANDEYFIYQSLVGAFPFSESENENFTERLQAYLVKAFREAKRHSNWSNPDAEYEEAVKKFVAGLLDKSRPFYKSFHNFLLNITDAGIINSLSQLLLKFTCPGVPDTYQGTELWDLSFVDPDNRRPVDYKKRQNSLRQIENIDQSEIQERLWQERTNGNIKLWLTNILLEERKRRAELFEKGEYIPLQVQGEYNDHVLAFARRFRNEWIVAAIPLGTLELSRSQDRRVTEIDWKDTRLLLPDEAPGNWTHTFTEKKGTSEKEILLSDIFSPLPFGLLKLKNINERGAGILLHITSLPSVFAIGDLGPEAKSFADFLARNGQKYWQLLPINPTEQGQGHSPYSAISGFAGNILLISPELLARDGLLTIDELVKYVQPNQGTVDYAAAEKTKTELLDRAWKNFQVEGMEIMKTQFESFRVNEKDWLDDFALYMLLKKQNGGKPWFEWPDEFRLREEGALQKLQNSNADEIEKIKWQQYIFSRQWKRLRNYCNNRGIELIGDLPFYVSYDSADVWANREIFALDKKGNPTGVAGVPPDAFSDDGQLWGMPVYNWDEIRKRNYDWWIRRLKKNIELFDVVRLDHFRAFAAYWEVPAGKSTAKNGKWKPGPGKEFFEAIEKALGSLPFIAEDLGAIDAPVHELRDAFHLPGMKVLQFAFSHNMPANQYIPHHHDKNFLVYTGTHDNNTTRGWWRQNIDDATRNRVKQYLGKEIIEEEISYIFCRLAYSSVAKAAILPLQDLLALDESGKMNTPASAEGNWQWRLRPGQLTHENENQLREWVWVYGRE